jgi:FtsP/CotA-like multicopper oxidase with cupredoxin domain
MTKQQRISRRMFLGGGLGIAGLASNVLALSTGGLQAHASSHISHASMSHMAGMSSMTSMAAGAVPSLPFLKNNVNPALNGGFDPSKFIQQFERGTVQRINGKQTRVFDIVSVDRPIVVAIDDNTGKPVQFRAWAFGTSDATVQVPGPTLRCTQGETVLINYTNKSAFTHSIHFHGIHNTGNDGSLVAAAPGQSVKYEFVADPPGLMAYHCHVFPGISHVGYGLYGAMIIDPPDGRKPMAELVLVMNGFATDRSNPTRNTVYAFNTVANHYGRNQIAIPLDQAIRIYLLNMCLDRPLTFHLHANFFDVYPSGTKNTPTQFNDMLTTAFLERYILEFTFDSKRFTPGSYMFHSHDDPGELGMFGMFLLTNGQATGVVS